MRRYLLIALSLLCTAVNAQVKSKHVILVSIDGLRAEFYLDAKYPTPHLQQLMTAGAYAQHMKSVFPSYTYPSHVAMLTGALPARSGIYYNAPIGSKGEWNWFTKNIKVATLWQAMHQQGLKTAAVQWPVSVGDDIDYNIPEIWSNEHPEDRISETRKYATKGLIEEIELNATGKLNGDNMNEVYAGLDENAGRMAAYIFKTYQPNFLAVHFAGVDGAQHEQGREGAKVKLALQNVDDAIGNIVESIERSGLQDSTTILIVGDHGFMDIHDVVRPNVWLKQNNLLQKAFFQPAGGSCFLYLRDTADHTTVNEVKRMIEQLPASYKKLFSVLNKQQLDRMGVDSSAVLALSAGQGIVFGGGAEGEVTGNASGGHHGYDPHMPQMKTGFIAAGNGIQQGQVIEQLCVTDIAPLIASLLGISFHAPDGKLVKGIMKH